MFQKPQEPKSSVFPDEIHNKIRKHFKELVRPLKLVKGTPSEVEKCIDLLIPRGGELPKCIFVSLEDYLSRLAILYRKILGVEHRKAQWNKIVASHSEKFSQLIKKWPTTNYLEKPRVTSNFSLRSLRVENEFEVFLFSVCSTLSILTRVVAAFLSENQDLHSHEKLSKVLLRKTKWNSLAGIIEEARAQWVDDVFRRRDDATHYVALIAPSIFYGKKDEDKESTSMIQVSIPKGPERFVSIWLDEVPAVGGTIRMSSSITEDDGTIISETYEIYDMDRRLLFRRTSPPRLSPMIDGREYMDETIEYLDYHIIEVLRELHERVREYAPYKSGA